MTDFASVADLSAKLGRDIPAAKTRLARRALADSTGFCKSEARQTIEFVADDVIELHPQGKANEIWLPERPVTAVSEIHLAGLKIFGYEFVHYGRVRWPFGTFLVAPTVTGIDPPQITVKYSHGYADIPDDIRGVCLSRAARIYLNPEGVATEQIATGYQAVYGPNEFSPEELRTLRKYRPRMGA